MTKRKLFKPPKWLRRDRGDESSLWGWKLLTSMMGPDVDIHLWVDGEVTLAKWDLPVVSWNACKAPQLRQLGILPELWSVVPKHMGSDVAVALSEIKNGLCIGKNTHRMS